MVYVVFWGIQWNDWVHSRAWVVLFWGTPWCDWVLSGTRVMCLFCGAQRGAWVTWVVWGYATERMNTGSKVSVMKSAGGVECECVCACASHTYTHIFTHTCMQTPAFSRKKAYAWVGNLLQGGYEFQEWCVWIWLQAFDKLIRSTKLCSTVFCRNGTGVGGCYIFYI